MAVLNTGMRMFILLTALSFHVAIHAQKPNPYHLEIISKPEAYLRSVKADSQMLLLDLRQTVPGIVLDIRYATDDNFTHRSVYPAARAFARLRVARALADVQAELEGMGMGLKVFDAYRPYQQTLLFWDIIHDTAYVASPSTGSRHNRGCAVDVSLVNRKTGIELQMPTPFDSFSPAASPGFVDVPAEAKRNRQLLIDIMSKHGFTVYPSEWWHFDFRGWKNYGLMDISFEELDRANSSLEP
jgi:D-alanyl-D-alanine dipeptidase